MDVSRRDFIGAAGGFFAVSGLSGCLSAAADRAAGEQAVFEGRSPHERLSLAYSHVKVGLETPFSILHISDTHLCAADGRESEFKRGFAKRRTAVFGGRMEEALRDSLSWAKSNVDAVLHTGDLIDFQTEANYELVKKYFGEAPGMFGCPGNHEYQRRSEGDRIRNTGEYNNLSAAELQKVFPFDLHFNSTVVGGVNFVSIEQTYGFVTGNQVERFHAEVKKGLPIVLSMHVPFMTDEIWRASCRFWGGCGKKYRSAAIAAARGDYKRQIEDPTTSSFIAYLKKEPLLKAICAGHLHITIDDAFSPTAREYLVGGNFLFHGREILFT